MRPTPVYGIAMALLFTACTEPTCGGHLSDACRKARDMAHAMGVQIADEYTDGNPILGDVAPMGGTGKGALSVRLTGMEREAIRVGGQTVRTDGSEAASRFSSDAAVAPVISIDAVIGAWGGTPVGQTRIGGVDILGSVIIAPNVNRGDVRVGGAPLVFGNGVRIGITEETRLIPAMSLSGMIRLGPDFSVSLPDLPTDSGQSVRIDLQRGHLASLEYRFAASKKVGKFGVSGGIGQNFYYISTDYVVDAGALGSGFESTSFNVTRTAAFVGATYTRDKLTFGAELGRVMGGDLPAMLNSFGDGRVTAARNHLSLGVRVPIGRTVDRR